MHGRKAYVWLIDLVASFCEAAPHILTFWYFEVSLSVILGNVLHSKY